MHITRKLKLYKPGNNKTKTATTVKLTIHHYEVLKLSGQFLFMLYCHDTSNRFLSVFTKIEHGKMEMVCEAHLDSVIKMYIFYKVEFVTAEIYQYRRDLF